MIAHDLVEVQVDGPLKWTKTGYAAEQITKYQCNICGRRWKTAPTDECPGAKVYFYDAWPEGLATERQLNEKGLIAWGEVAGVVWYTNKYIHPDGHWLRLFRVADAKPKPPIDEQRAAAQAKAKETARRNRTCASCGRDAGYKIKRADKRCGDCARHFDTIHEAREWLARDAVILDTETTGLSEGYDDVIQVSVIDLQGNILLDSYVKPTKPIVEEAWEEYDVPDWSYDDGVRLTAFGVNGISNAMVENAPTFPEIWQQLVPLLKGKAVIAYNAAFDKGMLGGCREKHGLPKAEWGEWLCAMIHYAQHYGEWHERYHDWCWQTLGFACANEHVTVDVPAHSGAGDCLRTLWLLRTLAAKDAEHVKVDG